MDSERRQERRLIIRVPMWVRSANGLPQEERGKHTEEGVESMNISIRGTYFAAEGSFQVGEEIKVRLKMPEVVVPGQKTQWCFTGRVTHVDRLGAHVKSGIGVHFLYYSAGNKPLD